MARYAPILVYVLLVAAGTFWIAQKAAWAPGGSYWAAFLPSETPAEPRASLEGTAECVLDYPLKDQAILGQVMGAGDAVAICTKDTCLLGATVAKLVCPQTPGAICAALLKVPKTGCQKLAKLRPAIVSGTEKTWIEITKLRP